MTYRLTWPDCFLVQGVIAYNINTHAEKGSGPVYTLYWNSGKQFVGF